MRKVPELRFDGFEEEWGERNIKELSNKVTGGGTPSTKNEEYWNGNIPWIQTSDINDDYIKIKKYNKYISSEAIDNSAAKLINSNSIAIVTRVGVGKVVKVDHEIATSQDFTNLSELNSEINFTTYLLKKTMERLSFILQGTSIKGITQKELLLTKIKLPISNVEQEKIGDLFKKIDDLIEIQESKVYKMEDFKKSMLQKMLPKKGELVPEFRFEGFDGEWESSTLKHIGIVKSGVGFPRKFQGGISGIPFFKVSDMNLGINNIIMKSAQNYVSESDITTNKWNVITDKPAIIFAKVGAAIFLERKRIVTEDFLIDNNMMAFIPKVKSDLYFLKVFLDTTRLAKYAQSGALPSYNANDIYSIPINLPSAEEQQKIGQFFKNLHVQIENEKKLLDSYKMIKKSLLQKMFV